MPNSPERRDQSPVPDYAKAALVQLVAGASLELGPARVRVNAVAPGFVRTPRLNTMLSDEQWTQIEKIIPCGRRRGAVGNRHPDSHVTGQTILIDGGIAGVVNLPKLSATGNVQARAEGVEYEPR